MRNNERCLKCGEKTFEIKKIAVPTTKTTKAKIGIDMFYLKICQNLALQINLYFLLKYRC